MLFKQDSFDTNLPQMLYTTSMMYKMHFSFDEIFIPYNKTFENPYNTRNNIITSNIKLTSFFQALATANFKGDTQR